MLPQESQIHNNFKRKERGRCNECKKTGYHLKSVPFIFCRICSGGFFDHLRRTFSRFPKRIVFLRLDRLFYQFREDESGAKKKYDVCLCCISGTLHPLCRICVVIVSGVKDYT